MKRAKEEEETAKKKEMVSRLKDAQLEIEMNILHSLISKDIVLFAYNYYRSVLCMHASEELDLETLEFYCTLPYGVEDWDLPSNIHIMDRYLPLEYNHNIHDDFILNDSEGQASFSFYIGQEVRRNCKIICQKA